MFYDFETVIVIATHCGEKYLAESLLLMKKWPVIVVDTGELSPAVQAECDKHDNVGYLYMPFKGYDTGAYLWAYWNVKAKNYLFLQDSVFPRDEDFVEQFQREMPKGLHGVVAWSSFNIKVWDSKEQCEATQWMYGHTDDWPTKGIFGPIFYTTRATLTHLMVRGLLPMPPVHKQGQQAMERAWAILFNRADVRVNFLVEEEMPNGPAMEQGVYPALRKVFPVRA